MSPFSEPDQLGLSYLLLCHQLRW